jgi:hypothetical protein
MNKKHQFNIGDRVGLATTEEYDQRTGKEKEVPLRYDPDGDGLCVGEVTDVSVKGKITVKWDHGSTYVVEASELLPEEELKNKWSELEAEFNEVEAQVKVKVKEIAKGIREANKLAKKTGRNLADMYDVVYGDLYRAMDEAGWRTSSFGC